MHIAQLDLSEHLCGRRSTCTRLLAAALALSCPSLLLLCRLLVSCCYLLVALRTNGCCALVVLVVYEQQDHVQHAECSRHIVATLALLFAGQLQPSGACFVLD